MLTTRALREGRPSPRPKCGNCRTSDCYA